MAESFLIGLQPGDRISNEECPRCSGGKDKDRSFYIRVSDNGEVYARCYRVKCGYWYRGNLGGVPTELRLQNTNNASARNTRTARRYPIEDTRSLEERERGQLRNLFSFEAADINRGGIRFNPKTERYTYPINSPIFTQRGVVARSQEGAKPKTINYFHEEGVLPISWYYPVSGKTPEVIIVEDQQSAIKVSRQYTAAAILGTNLTIDKVMEILRQGKEYYICLDKDATLKSIYYAKRYSLFGKFRHVTLEKDMKYLTDEEIKELINK
jgi:hypothetical protein